MKTKSLTSTLALLGMCFAGAPAMAAGVDAAMVSNTCAGCHGTNGISQGEAPTIAGLPEQYLKSTMQSYKDGSRYSTIMGRIAKGYSDAEFDAMAGFFSKQPWTPAKQDVDAALAAKGEAIHKENACAGCHGATGESPSPTTPNLNGQYADYLYFQMHDYKNPEVPVAPGAAIMRSMCQNLSDDQIKALAQFYASQQ